MIDVATSMPGTPTDPQRRAALLHVKLRALVREHLGEAPVDPPGADVAPFGRGAAMVVGDTAWVLLDDKHERGLGGALAWAMKHPRVRHVAVITEAASGVLARRAALFSGDISVWHAVERLLVPAVEDPYPPPMAVDPRHEGLRALIVAGGAEPIVEYGVLAGEVRGLEVCRAVTDAYTDEVRLEVGVGAHDREAFLMLHGARPTVEALADVARTVATHRQLGAALHPLNRFGAERFLRWRVLEEPALIGATGLAVADPPVPRLNVKDPVPCVAVGHDASGAAIVAVCSTGIDLDLVPFAADARAMHASAARLVLVVPERDAAPVTKSLAGGLRQPADIVTLP